MKFQALLALLMLAGPSAQAAVDGALSGREYAETVLLLSAKEADLRFGIKSLYKKPAISPTSLDLLAEIASAACKEKRVIDPDILAWIAKTIGKSEQGRYAPLIEECLAKATEKAKGKDTSLMRYLLEAKAALAGSPKSNPFVAGTLNLDKVRDDLAKNRKMVQAAIANEQFVRVTSGQSMDEVYSRVGAPEKIQAMSEPRGKAGFLFVKVKLSEDRIVFHYPALGDIRFGFDESTDNWVVADAASKHNLHWLLKDGKFATVTEVINNGEREDLIKVIRVLAKQKEPVDGLLLDRIANRIYLSQKETNGGVADTLAHMCKLLGKSGNGKYKQMLREVSEKAAHDTLRKYAAQSADLLPDTGEPPYKPSLTGAML